MIHSKAKLRPCTIIVVAPLPPGGFEGACASSSLLPSHTKAQATATHQRIRERKRAIKAAMFPGFPSRFQSGACVAFTA